MSIPPVYWILAFNFIQVQYRHDWNNTVLPHAEIIGQLTHPEIYREYDKAKKRREQINDVKNEGNYYKEDEEGFEGGGVTTFKYDPNKGLVNDKGNVVIPKEQYESMLGLDGVAISL